MFCKNCGTQLPEDSIFCNECGVKIVKKGDTEDFGYYNEPEQTQVLPDDSSGTEVLAENDVETATETVPQETVETPSAAPAFTPSQVYYPTAQKPKKKKGKAGRVVAVIISLVLVLALSVTAVFNWTVIAGTFLDIFGSDEAYFRFVTRSSLKGHTDDLLELYGDLHNASSNGYSRNLSLDLELNDRVITYAEQYIASQGANIDLDFLNDLSVKADFNYVGSLTKLDADLYIGEEFIMDYSSISDTFKGEQYISFPSVDSQYKYYGYLDIWGVSNAAFSLANERRLDNFIDKYVEIALSEVDDVSKEKVDITVDGVTQRLTAFDVRLDTKTMYAIEEAVYSELEDDEQFKELVKTVTEALENEDKIDDADDAYDMVIDGIKHELDRIDDVEYENKTEFEITVYVNAKQEITGLKVTEHHVYRDYQQDEFGNTVYDYNGNPIYEEVKGETDIIDWVTVRDGEEFGTDITYAYFNLVGGGTEKGGKISGKYAVNILDSTYVNNEWVDEWIDMGDLELENFDKKLYEKEKLLSFTLTYTPAQSPGIFSSIPLANPKLKLIASGEDITQKMELKLNAGGIELGSLKLKAIETVPQSIDSFNYESPNSDNYSEYWSRYWTKIRNAFYTEMQQYIPFVIVE